MPSSRRIHPAVVAALAIPLVVLALTVAAVSAITTHAAAPEAGYGSSDSVESYGDSYRDGTVSPFRRGLGTSTAPVDSGPASDSESTGVDIVSGDSGGALLDEDGEVIGMNVAATSGSAEISGYAIPIDTVLDIASRILAGTAGEGLAA